MTNNDVVVNTKWIITCKIVQSIIQLVVGVLCARYLGPNNYGLIGYAGSIVAFVAPFVQLGLQATIVKELVDAPEKEGTTLGTAIGMEIISAFIGIALVNAFSLVANPDEPLTIIVCALSSISLLFKSVELIQRWFQFKLQSKYPSVIAVCVYIVVSAYRIYLLVTSKSVIWFTVTSSLESCLMCVALVCVYNKLGAAKMKFSFFTAKQLIRKSKYYILSAVMVTIFQNTDHVMLKMMVGEVENGFYTAAVTTSALALFVFSAVVDSMRPMILEYKKNLDSRYEKLLCLLYCVIFYLAMIQGICFTCFSKLIIGIFYGNEFMEASVVLKVIVWQISFSYMGSIRNIWILAEGKQSLVWKLNLFGVVVNIGLNALLIPQIGARGAALASLLTQMFTNFILGFLIPQLKGNNRLLLSGIHPRMLLQVKREFIEYRKHGR